MANDLLCVGLKRLQGRLSSVAKPDALLNCWLIEWRNMWASHQSRTPGLWDETVVWESDGPLDGNDGDSDDREPFRELHISTTRDGVTFRTIEHELREDSFWNMLRPILVDAGNLLPRIRAGVLPLSVSSATPKTSDSLEWWLYFLFDLAWAKIPESPLRVSIDKKFSWLPAIKQFTRDIHGNTPAPDCWYSVIDDVTQASVYAIDILLTMEVDSQDAAGNNRMSVAEIVNGEGKDVPKRRGAPKKKETKQRADFVKLLHDEGLTWPEVYARYAETPNGQTDQGADADAMRHAYEREYPAK